MTSSDFRDRSARPCSPRAQRRASARLLLPDPLGPTTALMPGPNVTSVRSAKDLKPWSRTDSRRPGPSWRLSWVVLAGRIGRTAFAAGQVRFARLLMTAEGEERLGRCAGLGHAAGWTARQTPTHDIVHDDLDPERFGRDPARRPRPARYVGARTGSPLRALLEPTLRALEGRGREDRRSIRAPPAREPVARRRPSRDRGKSAPVNASKRRGQQRRPHAAATWRLALAEQEGIPEVEPLGDPGQASGADDGGTAGRQDAFVVHRDGAGRAPRR